MSGKNNVLDLNGPGGGANFLVFYTYEHLKFHAQLV